MTLFEVEVSSSKSMCVKTVFTKRQGAIIEPMATQDLEVQPVNDALSS